MRKTDHNGATGALFMAPISLSAVKNGIPLSTDYNNVGNLLVIVNKIHLSSPARLSNEGIVGIQTRNRRSYITNTLDKMLFLFEFLELKTIYGSETHLTPIQISKI